MNYIKRKGDVFEKHSVFYDKEELTEFRRQVIEECSEIVHHEYNAIEGPDETDDLRIRNYECKKIGTVLSVDSSTSNGGLYHFSYDEYRFPYLVELIDELLNGNARVLDQINYPNLKKENPHLIKGGVSFEEKVKKVSQELNAIDNLNIEAKKKKLDELQACIEMSKLNENQKPVDDYYSKLQSLIRLELVGSMPSRDVFQVVSFFEHDFSLLD